MSWRLLLVIALFQKHILCSVAAFTTCSWNSAVGRSQQSGSQSIQLISTWARRSGSQHQKAKNGRQKDQKQEEIQSMLSTMGLTPVRSDPKVKTPGPKHSKGHKSAGFISSQINIRTQLGYSRNGHAVLRNFIDPKVVQNVRKVLRKHARRKELSAWQQKVVVASNSPKLGSSCKSVGECQQQRGRLGITDSIPFLQFFNTWRTLDVVKDLSYSLASAASVLMDVPSIRLYQDAVFWKRTDDGPTPWHIDSRMAPFDTANFITFWIPLQAVPADGTGLTFCSKSHADIALPYWNPVDDARDRRDSHPSEWDRLEDRYPEELVHYMPMQVGDVTVHSGWTLHCANSNESNDRMALAISFVDAQAEVREDVLDKSGGKGDNEDNWSYESWVKDVTPRTRFDHSLVPIVWPQSEAHP